MKKLKLFFALFAMLALGISNAWGAALGSGYEKVTNISSLTTGDKVVLYCDDAFVGVTGWGGSNDAKVAASGFVEYLVTVVSGGVTLKDETAGKYIAKPTGNHFKYNTTAGTCSVNTKGVLACNSRYLYKNGTYYRMYADKSSDTNYKPFYVYKVVTDAGGDETEDLGDALKWSAAAATVQMGADDNEYPTLTNDKNVDVTYSSSSTTVATIDANGVVTLVKEGTTTISAFYEGGEIEGVTYSAKTVSYTLTVKPAPLVIEPIVGGIVDILTHSTFAATNNSYTNFSGKQAKNDNHSDAVYAGRSARNGNATQYSIQLNTIDKGRIATTTTGGLAKRVYVKWATQTANTNARTLDIYGSNTALTGSESTVPSTKIGTIKYTTGAAEAYVDLTGDYKYILMVGSGAIYMDEIHVTWVSAAGTVVTPTISGETEFVESTEVSIATETGYKVYYTLDGTDPTNASTEYTAPFTVNTTTTVKAIAYNSTTAKSSAVTEKTFTKTIIPTKTIAGFIEDQGGRCYLEGIVSGLTEGNSMKYGNFDLTDASGTIYVYGCLNAAGESKKFAELGVKNGDKIKVIADVYELYNGTTEEAKNVQYVSHVSAATITIENITLVEGDEHTIVAVVTPAEAVVTYTIKENTANAISLLDNTITALAEGTATITATVAEGATYMGNSVDFTVTVKEYVAPISGIWELVTDASTLKAGDKVIVASVELEGKYYTMGKQNSNNRAAIESTVNGSQLTPTTGTSVLTLVDAGDGKFAFQASNGKYLSAAGTGDNNYLREAENYDSDKTKWTISVTAEGVATIKATSDNRNWMRYNKSSIIFSCYGSGQTDIALYKRMPDYTRVVDPQYYGTICLPKAGKFIGGSLYEVAYYDETTKKVYFDEVLNGEMEAGMPYIFLANATMIEAYYTNDEEAAAKHKNGLYGTLVDITSGMNADGVYMIYRNQIIHSTHQDSYLKANRAYIKFTEELPGYNDPSYVAQAPALGRKRIAMGTTGQNTATGVDQVQDDNVPTKMIINGQLFILRGEKMYDAQGKLVK